MLSEKAIKDRIKKHRESQKAMNSTYILGRIWEAEAILNMDDDEYFEEAL